MKVKFSQLEKEMINFNFDDLESVHTESLRGIATAESAADIKEKICSVWSKIRKYVVLAEAIPVIGKFIKILVELLDAICNAG